MAKYQRFEDLPVWQDAARLYNIVLDLFEMPGLPLSSGYRNQLDRAALSVSNNIAEGFERVSSAELLQFLAFALGSSGEVRSMIAVVSSRPSLHAFAGKLDLIRSHAESCARQLTKWIASIEESPVQGKRHQTPELKRQRSGADKAAEYRIRFLQSLGPDHPLYATDEAKAAWAKVSK